MSSVLTVDDKEYISATLAGKHFGYTKDYLLLLAKEGKLDGKKIANKWYIYIPSAEQYFCSAEKGKNDRRIQMSLARKAELKKHVRARKIPRSQPVLVETLAIVVLGLAIGVTGYFGAVPQVANVSAAEMSFLEKIARSIYTMFGPEKNTEVTSNLEGSVSLAPVASIATHQGAPASFVIAPEYTFTEEIVADVRESFSDPVEVTINPENPDTGIVTPVFKDGKKAESYRFLLVPVITN